MYRARPLAPHTQEMSSSSCPTSHLRVGQVQTSLNFWIGLLISMLSLRRAKSLIGSLFEVTFDLKMFISDIQLDLESVYYVTFHLMLNQAPMVPPSALPPPPTSPRDLLVASLGSTCPSTPTNELWFPQAPPPLPTSTNESSGLVGGFLGLHLPFHHHQRVLASRNLLVASSGSTCPSTPTNKLWFPGPPPRLPTPINGSQRLVGGFLSLLLDFPPPPTSHQDLLVAFSASICPSTTTNESS